MSVFNRIRHAAQRSKRKELLNKYGFYETVETQRGILTCTNDIFGTGGFRSKYTTFHIHTMLDCPFLIKPHDKDETEYTCRLILESTTYNIVLEDVIYRQDTPFLSSHYNCKCVEWTGHYLQEYLTDN